VTTYAEYQEYVAEALAAYSTSATPMQARPRQHCKPCELSSLEDVCFACGGRMSDGELPKPFMSPKTAAPFRTNYGTP
jgi:hypothetical protein